MGYGVVFKKTHWVWGFEKVMKSLLGGLDEKKSLWGGGGLHEKKIFGGGGMKLWAFHPHPPPPPPHVFLNGIALNINVLSVQKITLPIRASEN